MDVKESHSVAGRVGTCLRRCNKGKGARAYEIESAPKAAAAGTSLEKGKEVCGNYIWNTV